MRRTWNRIVLLLLAVAPVLSLTACGKLEIKDDPAMRCDADVFLDALVAGDPDAAYAAVYSGIDRTQFDTGFSQMHAYVKDVEEFTLEPIHYNYSNSNGTVTIQLTYRMTTEQGSFIVTAARIEGDEGLAAVHIVSEAQFPDPVRRWFHPVFPGGAGGCHCVLCHAQTAGSDGGSCAPVRSHRNR